MIPDNPPGDPPAELKDAFEEFGNMPIRKHWYFNNKYVYPTSNDVFITNKTLEDIQYKSKNKIRYGTYGKAFC
jgi:hypothetical protein